ncbi:hypothetical protein [Francisella-like endosymbiont]|uniref:hypothetical protein n=1 Tax=Francisella-like endosymbiont TaxID=512373 RepID=UPI00296EC469
MKWIINATIAIKNFIAQGTGNIVCSFFGGMAGLCDDWSIYRQFYQWWAGAFIFINSCYIADIICCRIIWVYSYIPVAVLAGIMLMVCIILLNGRMSIVFGYMPNADKVVLVVVTVIIVFSDLAIAIISGVIISALVFVWKSSQVHSRINIEDQDTKVYEFFGPLFFGSTSSFKSLFDVNYDPDNIILDFANF